MSQNRTTPPNAQECVAFPPVGHFSHLSRGRSNALCVATAGLYLDPGSRCEGAGTGAWRAGALCGHLVHWDVAGWSHHSRCSVFFEGNVSKGSQAREFLEMTEQTLWSVLTPTPPPPFPQRFNLLVGFSSKSGFSAGGMFERRGATRALHPRPKEISGFSKKRSTHGAPIKWPENSRCVALEKKGSREPEACAVPREMR